MAVFLSLPLVVGVGAALLAVFLPASSLLAVPAHRWAGGGVSAVILLSGLALAADVLSGHVPTALNGELRADALSAFLLLVVGAVGVTSTWGGLTTGDPGRGYPALVSVFLAAMTLAAVGIVALVLALSGGPGTESLTVNGHTTTTTHHHFGSFMPTIMTFTLAAVVGFAALLSRILPS